MKAKLTFIIGLFLLSILFINNANSSNINECEMFCATNSGHFS